MQNKFYTVTYIYLPYWKEKEKELKMIAIYARKKER